MKIMFESIKWDCEDDERDVLPSALSVEIEEADDFADDEEGLTDFLSDWLSDEYGYCHKGFDYTVVED